MLIPVLVSAAIVFGALAYYIYYIAPKLNPMNRAETFLSEGRVADAVLEYRKLIDQNPRDSLAHYKIAQLYFDKLKDQDKGIKHLEEILDIGKFDIQVDKTAVQKKLAAAYLLRDEVEKAFSLYVDILKEFPADYDALYYASFILLGQEYFDAAFRLFARLAGKAKKDFRIMFGAGMAAFQNQKISEAINFLREALAVDPHSDIANLAIAFALREKRDYKTAVNYTRMIVDSTRDETARFVAKRLLGILLVQGRTPEEGVKVFQDLAAYVKKNEMEDELPLILYDLGFACLRAEMTNEAYEYFNELYEIDRGFKNVQGVVTELRKEMAHDSASKGSGDALLTDYYKTWLDDSFPENYVWHICGLKNSHEYDIRTILDKLRPQSSRDKDAGGGDGAETEGAGSGDDILTKYFKLDVETFKIVSNRAVSKMGYKVDEILPTYRENDGVDFMAVTKDTGEKTLVWVRRWKGTNIGEIPLRNFAQAVNDSKAKRGLFVTATPLTQSGESATKHLSKVEVIPPEKLADALAGFI